MSFSDVAAMHTRKRTASSSSASEVPVPSTGDQATDSAKRDVLPNSIHTPTSVTHDRRTPKLEPHSTRYSTLEVGTPTAGVGVSWPSQRTAASTRAIAAADSYAQLAKDNLGDDVKAPPRGGKTLAAVVRLVKMTRGLEQDYSFRLFNRAVRGTTLDKELEEKRALSQKKRMKYIILPDSRFHSVWDSLSLVWIFLNVLMVPYWVAFDVETGTVWFVVDLLVDVWFCVDILLNFRTAYADDGDLQTHWKSIAFHYLRTYFALDVLATFPFAWVVGIVVEVSEGACLVRAFFVPPHAHMFFALFPLPAVHHSQSIRGAADAAAHGSTGAHDQDYSLVQSQAKLPRPRRARRHIQNNH